MAQEVTLLKRKGNAMILERELEFRGSRGSEKLITLFDSGSTYSCISLEKAEALEQSLPLPEPIDVETASSGNFIRITHRAPLDFRLNDLRLTDEFMIVPGLSEDAIIGATTLQKWRIKLDFEHDQIITDPRAAKLKLI
jgi:hypothetical protein